MIILKFNLLMPFNIPGIASPRLDVQPKEAKGVL
jgi:hypothetical protein